MYSIVSSYSSRAYIGLHAHVGPTGCFIGNGVYVRVLRIYPFPMRFGAVEHNISVDSETSATTTEHVESAWLSIEIT